MQKVSSQLAAATDSAGTAALASQEAQARLDSERAEKDHLKEKLQQLTTELDGLKGGALANAQQEAVHLESVATELEEQLKQEKERSTELEGRLEKKLSKLKSQKAELAQRDEAVAKMSADSESDAAQSQTLVAELKAAQQQIEEVNWTLTPGQC